METKPKALFTVIHHLIEFLFENEYSDLKKIAEVVYYYYCNSKSAILT